MPSYEHTQLMKALMKLSEVPQDSAEFARWILGKDHLDFLHRDVFSKELVIYGVNQYCFIHSVVVSNTKLFPIDKDDLLEWSFNAYNSIASYVSIGSENDMKLERGLRETGTKTLEDAIQLIFARTFEGWSGQDRTYCEVNQEFIHLANIHWRPEKQAYCQFDAHGDLEPVISMTVRDDKGKDIDLVTFTWESLEEYLTISNSSLVRMFDFTLFKIGNFNGWSNEMPEIIYDTNTFFYHQKVMSENAGYIRGVQIIKPQRSKEMVINSMMNRWRGNHAGEYATFIAYDWRNKCITKISTDPSMTTNYFEAESNSLPFELSPAFFKPEVLQKYKMDRDKYTIQDRSITCRATWMLQRFDVNEAEQVHVYICDLRQLPYTEQLHWLSFNEEPKAPISERAISHDFKGEWTRFNDPLQEIVEVTRRWDRQKVPWWQLRDPKLTENVTVPFSASRDEWAESFMDLAKLVIEGFETKPLRSHLDLLQVSYTNEERTIALLEKVVNAVLNEHQKLDGLRTVQNLRSKAKGHAAGSEAEKLARNALQEHETYTKHFNHVCTKVVSELETIERCMQK